MKMVTTTSRYVVHYNPFVYRSDRSRFGSWKGGEAFSLNNKPDVLEQQSNWSSNRGIDCHNKIEGGGLQHPWKDDSSQSSMYIEITTQ